MVSSCTHQIGGCHGNKVAGYQEYGNRTFILIVSQTKPTGICMLLIKNNLFLMKEGDNLSPEPCASYFQELSYWILTNKDFYILYRHVSPHLILASCLQFHASLELFISTFNHTTHNYLYMI